MPVPIALAIDTLPRAVGVQQAGDAEVRVGTECQRIEEVVVHAPVDHVDAAQAGRRPHVDDVVVDEQVAPFDERNAHLPREERVLEVGRVADAGRQHDDRRVGTVGGASARSVASSAWP